MTTQSLIYPISNTKLFSLRLPRVSFAGIWIFCFICIALLLGFYIFQIDKTAANGFLIENYERNFKTLSLQNENLAVSSVQFGSLKNLEYLVKNLNFEKAGKIHYIRILESAVVKK